MIDFSSAKYSPVYVVSYVQRPSHLVKIRPIDESCANLHRIYTFTKKVVYVRVFVLNGEKLS